jgi:glycerol dehydrogenase
MATSSKDAAMTQSGQDPNIRAFGSPPRYYQGPGALDGLPGICLALAARPFLVVDADVLVLIGPRLNALFGTSPHKVTPFRGEVTAAAMDAISAQARDFGADLIVGIGGGKALDVGKGCARRTGQRFVSVPTVASNDSPTSVALAVYDDHHRMVAVEALPANPEAVVVDTRLIAGAPAHFLRAGIGDAIAKKFEGEASQRHGGVNAHHTYQLRTAGYIADGCYRTIREFAVEAMAAAGTGEATPALEAVIEANILMAGLAFENMGLGLAHGITRGLVRVPEVDRAPHGFHVAYGTLVLLAAEGRPPEFIDEMAAFFGALGLPRSLTEMGLANVDRDTVRAIAANTAVAPAGSYLLVPVGEQELIAAIGLIEDQFQRTARKPADA